MKVSAEMLKALLISYFRFKRQSVAIDEVGCSAGTCDVLVDNGKFITEIEVKISKSDLIIGERKKGRHPIGAPTPYLSTPNRYYLCVPIELEECALKWIEDTHSKYGLFVFDPKYIENVMRRPHISWGDYLHVRKKAQFLHKEYRENVFRKICMRASASLCAFIGERAFRVAELNSKREETAVSEASK